MLLLDLAGNVWGWTRSLDNGIPFVVNDGREDLTEDDEFDKVFR